MYTLSPSLFHRFAVSCLTDVHLVTKSVSSPCCVLLSYRCTPCHQVCFIAVSCCLTDVHLVTKSVSSPCCVLLSYRCTPCHQVCFIYLPCLVVLQMYTLSPRLFHLFAVSCCLTDVHLVTKSVSSLCCVLLSYRCTPCHQVCFISLLCLAILQMYTLSPSLFHLFVVSCYLTDVHLVTKSVSSLLCLAILQMYTLSPSLFHLLAVSCCLTDVHLVTKSVSSLCRVLSYRCTPCHQVCFISLLCLAVLQIYTLSPSLFHRFAVSCCLTDVHLVTKSVSSLCHVLSYRCTPCHQVCFISLPCLVVLQMYTLSPSLFHRFAVSCCLTDVHLVTKSVSSPCRVLLSYRCTPCHQVCFIYLPCLDLQMYTLSPSLFHLFAVSCSLTDVHLVTKSVSSPCRVLLSYRCTPCHQVCFIALLCLVVLQMYTLSPSLFHLLAVSCCLTDVHLVTKSVSSLCRVLSYRCTPCHQVCFISLPCLVLQMYTLSPSLFHLFAVSCSLTDVHLVTKSVSSICRVLTYRCTPCHQVCFIALLCLVVLQMYTLSPSLFHLLAVSCCLTDVHLVTKSVSSLCRVLSYRCTPCHQVCFIALLCLAVLQMYTLSPSLFHLFAMSCLTDVHLVTKSVSSLCHVLSYRCTPCHQVCFISLPCLVVLQMYTLSPSLFHLFAVSCLTDVHLVTKSVSSICRVLFSYRCTPCHQVCFISLPCLVVLQMYTLSPSLFHLFAVSCLTDVHLVTKSVSSLCCVLLSYRCTPCHQVCFISLPCLVLQMYTLSPSLFHLFAMSCLTDVHLVTKSVSSPCRVLLSYRCTPCHQVCFISLPCLVLQMYTLSPSLFHLFAVSCSLTDVHLVTKSVSSLCCVLLSYRCTPCHQVCFIALLCLVVLQMYTLSPSLFHLLAVSCCLTDVHLVTKSVSSPCRVLLSYRCTPCHQVCFISLPCLVLQMYTLSPSLFHLFAVSCSLTDVHLVTKSVSSLRCTSPAMWLVITDTVSGCSLCSDPHALFTLLEVRPYNCLIEHSTGTLKLSVH